MCDRLSDVHIGRLSRIWPVLEFKHFFCSEIRSEEDCLLFRSNRFFTSLQHLTFYMAQSRLCLEYGLHLWRKTSKHSLATLNEIQKRAIRVIDDPSFTASLDPLARWRSVYALSLFNRYYHGVLRWFKVSNSSQSIVLGVICRFPTPLRG